MIFSGEDTTFENFLALYSCDIVTAYNDGRIKIRTAGYHYIDVHRDKNIEQNRWVFDPAEWAAQILDADAQSDMRPILAIRPVKQSAPQKFVPKVPRKTI
jgi:hypothetical protein